MYPHDPTLTGSRDAMLFAAHAVGAILRASPTGRFQTATGNPYARDSNPVQLADPGQAAIRRIRDLAVDPAVPEAFTTTTEAARALQNVAASDPAAASSLQLVEIGAAP